MPDSSDFERVNSLDLDKARGYGTGHLCNGSTWGEMLNN